MLVIQMYSLQCGNSGQVEKANIPKWSEQIQLVEKRHCYSQAIFVCNTKASDLTSNSSISAR